MTLPELKFEREVLLKLVEYNSIIENIYVENQKLKNEINETKNENVDLKNKLSVYDVKLDVS